MKIEHLQKKNLALCIHAGKYQGVSLFAMKIYEYLPNASSEKQGFLRVIDEDGEPYYYDAKAFLKIKKRPNGLTIPFSRPKTTRRKHRSIRVSAG